MSRGETQAVERERFTPPPEGGRFSGLSALPIPAGSPMLPPSITPEPGQRVQLPAFNAQPRGAKPITFAGQSTLSGTAVVVIFSLAVDPNLNLKLTAIGFSAKIAYLEYLDFTLLVNGVPQFGYANVPALLGNFQRPIPIDLGLNGSDTLDVQVKNNWPNTSFGAVATVFLTGYLYREQ
jgi:hypothetical protein